jgi:UPF0271 protein
MPKVDLNCDLGESFGAYALGSDEAVLPFISSANVACGFHAADPTVMRRTVAAAAAAGVAVGAHPGFPDLMGFGRRELAVSPAEAKDYVLYQIGALAAFCAASGIRLSHVKPHGALYNMAGKDRALAAAICEAVREFDPGLILLGLSGSELLRAAEELGLHCRREVFADRAYESDGSLVSRKKSGALIDDEEVAVRRALRMVTEGKVTAIDGVDIAVRADSVCVHGDGDRAAAFVRKIRGAFEAEGVAVVPLAEILEDRG